MKSSLCRIAAAALMLCLFLLSFGSAALSEDKLTVELPVKISAEGTLPKAAETYVVRMTANEKDNPMPNHQSGGKYDLSVVGVGAASFPAIEYGGVGIFTYKIEQLAGTNPDCKYDARSYTMKVTVTNAAGGGFDAAVALREDGEVEKPDAAEFHNVYKTVPKPTTRPGGITPTGVSDNWLAYLAGAAALLVVAGCIIYFLCRKGDD